MLVLRWTVQLLTLYDKLLQKSKLKFNVLESDSWFKYSYRYAFYTYGN